MKRLSSSGSLAALISMASSKDERDKKTNHGYSREFQAMLDSLEEEDYADQEASHIPHGKKRRLTLDQVKALEKNFEVENKLEPERKMKLAGELGLQPRQVAIWFQNRRARWKTKQLERDYGALKANYETLKLDYKELEEQHVALSRELKELKAKLGGEENADSSSQSEKEEYHASESGNNASAHSQNKEFISNNNNIVTTTNGGVIKGHSCSNVSSAHAFMNWIQFSDARTIMGGSAYQVCQPHLVKIEEQTLFGTEDSCNFLSVDQPPALYWHFSEQ